MQTDILQNNKEKATFLVQTHNPSATVSLHLKVLQALQLRMSQMELIILSYLFPMILLIAVNFTHRLFE